MQAISRIAAVAVLIASCAQGQTVQPDDQAAQAGAPAQLEHPPVPPELAPLSQDFQAAMANSQLQTYRYTQLTEQALALKKLCDTGFGPADICPKPGSSADPDQAATVADLPTVEEIAGAGNGLHAVLIFADGRRLTVHTGSVLPNGLSIAAVTGDDVRVRGAGRESVLYFADGQAK
jgi:hypothetical protein